MLFVQKIASQLTDINYAKCDGSILAMPLA